MSGYEPRSNKVELQKNRINGQHSYLLEYYNKARAGFEALKTAPYDVKAAIGRGDIVIIGQELWQELENLIEDLDNPEYFYQQDDALLRQDFIETFCRHTKSPFYGKPFILELWERAVLETFYSFKWTETGHRRLTPK